MAAGKHGGSHRATGGTTPNGEPGAKPGTRKPKTRRRWLIGLAGLAIVVLGLLTWVGLTTRSTYNNLTASRDELVQAQAALKATDLAAAQDDFDAAAEHASSAAQAVNGPMWKLATHLPRYGDSATAVQSRGDVPRPGPDRTRPSGQRPRRPRPRHPGRPRRIRRRRRPRERPPTRWPTPKSESPQPRRP